MKEKILEIYCTNKNCNTWFQSPFTFGNLDGFDVSAFKGLYAQCPNCGHMVTGTTNNYRVITLKRECC